jgi:hypothetical protein
MKAPGTLIPKTMDEAREADMMLMSWKAECKTWAEITEEWTRITGKKCGDSTLSARHFKIQQNIVGNGGEYVS